MTNAISDSVLILEEVAEYLKIPEEKVARQVLQGKSPG